MDSTFLEFEKPIAEIEAKLEELQYITDESGEGLSLEIARLKSKSQAITKNIYNSLSDWQIVSNCSTSNATILFRLYRITLY